MSEMARGKMTETERDALIEKIARTVEEFHFLEMRGVMAPRKADRLKAQHRAEGWAEARASFAEDIRRMKRDRGSDINSLLAEFVAMENEKLVAGRDYGRFWPLIEERLVEAHVHVPLFGNTIPMEAPLRMAITDKGRRRLSDPEPQDD